MQRKSVFGLLFVFSLVSPLLLPSPRLAMAGPPPLLEEQVVSLQPAAGVDNLTTSGEVGAAATPILYPSGDAPVRQGAPDSTAPDVSHLGAGYDDGALYGSTGLVRSYLRFDLSSVPASSTIVSATLRLYQAGGADYSGTLRTVTFYRVAGDWNEATITWSNRPAYAEASGSVTTTYNYLGWVSMDLTALVRAWVNGSQANYGLVAIGPESDEGVFRDFASRETGLRAELYVHYLPVPPPVLDVSCCMHSIKASSPQQLPVQVSNVTTGSLNWTAAKLGGAAWLSLSKSSGSATPTMPDNLGLTVNPTGLTPGVYTEQIRVSSDTPGVSGSPLTVTVTLQAFDHLQQVYLPLILKDSTGSSAPPIVALVVGIADYQNLGPPPDSGSLPDAWGYDLVAPKYDVADTVNYLKTELGVQANNIIQRGESAATRARVIEAFEELDQKENAQTIDIIYYSGHGGQVPDVNGDESDGKDEFIAMYNTDEVLPGSFINVLTDDDLRALLANLESNHIIVIIDACFSGGMGCCSVAQAGSGDLRRRGLVNPSKPGTVSAQDAGEICAQDAMCDLVGPGRVVITSGTGDESTWESDSLQNGVFTYFFLQGLQDELHDANQNSRISAEEAYWFSRDAVDSWVYAHEPGYHQRPNICDQVCGQVDLTWVP